MHFNLDYLRGFIVVGCLFYFLFFFNLLISRVFPKQNPMTFLFIFKVVYMQNHLLGCF